MPAVHGIALQQSASMVQIWPYCEQTGGGSSVVPESVGVPESVVVPASVLVPLSGNGVPLSGGGGVMTPHLPCVLPCDTMQFVPGQQSPVMVQLPPAGTQIVPPSGTFKQRSCPVSSGTHGTLLQQSPVNAHVSPPLRQVPIPWHRGTPSGSRTQASGSPTAPQQLLGAVEMLHA